MLKGALLLIAGAALGWSSQVLERARDYSTLMLIAQDNETMAKSMKAIRAACPARVRFQRGLMRFTPGGEV